MTKIAASTAKVTVSDLRAIRFTSLRGLPRGTHAYVNLHDEPGVLRRIISATLPEGSLKDWGVEQATVRVQGRGEIQVGPHSFAGPIFPVFQRPSDRAAGGTTNERMTVYIGKDQFVSENEKLMATKPQRPRGRPVGSKDSAPRVRRKKEDMAG